MVDKDKSLKIKSNSIFEKICDYFRNFFRKKKNIFETEEINLKEDIDIEEVANQQEVQSETEKTEFFKLYQDIKSGKANLDDLDTFDLVRVNLMLTQEIDIQTNNVHKELEHIQDVNEKIVDIKRKNLIA